MTRHHQVRVGAAGLALALALATACAGGYRREGAALGGTRVGPSAPEQVVRVRWKRKLVRHGFMSYRPQEWAAAAVDEHGTAYVGSSNGRLSAHAVADGAELWTFKARGAVASTPLFHAPTATVYFGADDGYMYAVDAKTGQERWRYATQGTIRPAPVFQDGFLLFSTSEGRVYGLDARSGKWRWQYEREPPEGFTIHGYAGVAVAGNTAYTGFADGTLVALRVYSGDVVWTRALTAGKSRFVDVDTTPVLARGKLLAASYSGGVHAVSPDTGSIRWRHPVEAVSGLMVHHGRIFAVAPRAGVTCLDDAGHLLWRQAIPMGVPARPAALGPYLFVTGTETGLYVVDARTGALRQYFDPGHGISAHPTARAGTLTLLSNQGWLYSFVVRGERGSGGRGGG